MPPERAEIGGQDHGHLSAQSVTSAGSLSRSDSVATGSCFVMNCASLGMYEQNRELEEIHDETCVELQT